MTTRLKTRRDRDDYRRERDFVYYADPGRSGEGVAHLGALGAPRDDLLRIVDAIPGVPAEKFVTSLEATVSAAASKAAGDAVRPMIIKGALLSAGIGIAAILIARRRR